MTKVILSRSLFEYRQAMAELVNQVCQENRIIAADRPSIEDFGPEPTNGPELGVPGLLRPPRIESLWPDICLKDGHLDGIIQISTSEYFGVMNVYVSLKDDRGNHLESDYALDNEIVQNHWGYFASAPASPGTTIVVHAIAIDRLGGIAIQTDRLLSDP
jgi:hypothetical protein